VPRVDAGWYLLEVSRAVSLSEGDLREVVEWALSSRALVALEPGVASVRGPLGVILVAYGPGSLFSAEAPPAGGYLELARSEWVTGCTAGSREPRFRVAGGAPLEVEGVIVAREYRDPVALIVNGLRGRHELAEASLDGWEVYAEVGGRPVLAYSVEEGYLSLALSGEALKRISYAAPLVSSCSG
jgi:hypothetical protein